ncbi:MAG: GumC family protein [Bacteroidota bacterium]
MDIYSFVQLIFRNLKYILIAPVIFGGLTIFMTRDQPRTYNVNATFFTGMTTGSSITNIDNEKIDLVGAQAQYNNMLSVLQSRSVKKETSLRLLSMFLTLEKPDPTIISNESYQELMTIVPQEVKKLTVPNNIEKTYENLKAYKTKDEDNFIYGLLNFTHPYLSYKALSNIDIRKDGSDIIKLSYEGSDPGIIYQTIKITMDVFTYRYHLLKDTQAEAVVEYFENKLHESLQDLARSEDELLEFNKTNNIINYYEQTRHISSQQEKLELNMQEVAMDYEAASAVLQKLETETQSRYRINLKNSQIMELRDSLIAVNQEIAEREIDEEFNETSNSLQKLQQKKALLETNLSQKVDSLNIFERNSDGIELESVLSEWLSTVIEYESAHSRLLAMKRKIEEFQSIYAQYAPLGATIKKIEREINVKEREYLNLLHHLGLAKLKQQNDSMTSNMEILDPPEFPINALPGKRKIYVAIASLFSMIFVVAGILLFELLDKTIKTTRRLEKFSGIPCNGAVLDKYTTSPDLFHNITQRSLKPIIELIARENQNRDTNSALVVQIFSLWEGEGKSFITQQLKAVNENIGISTFSAGFVHQQQTSEHNLVLSSKESFDYNDYQQMLNAADTPRSKVIIFEIPALATHTFNTNLFQTADVSLLVTNMGRTWSDADDYHTSKLNSYGIPNLFAVSNRIMPGAMEHLTGDLPKKRSKFRVFMKNKIMKRFLIFR